jgi:peptidoglycan/xylan/chitin deacetylase (PgdA/CDA1 family)
LAFVRGLRPDLGLAVRAPRLPRELFSAPRLGTLALHPRQLPDYRGGGPVGLWELIDGREAIGVTVHVVTEELSAGPVVDQTTFQVGPYDTLRSLALKADEAGADLTVRCLAAYARGEARPMPQEGPSRLFRDPGRRERARLERRLAAARPAYRVPRGRPAWKLFLRTLALPAAAARNWSHRRRGTFPVVVLFHHVVSDRPHRMGIPTELFLRQVRFLQRGYRVVGLEEARSLLEAGVVREPTVVLTFDDGYADNFLNLRAVASATGAPVTLFVCPGHITTGAGFDHDLRRGERGFPPLSWDQVALLDRLGVTIGSHTRWHFDCGSTDAGRIRDEVAGSREDLEVRLGHEVRTFAFPWGKPANMSPVAVAVARECYPVVCSAHGGVNLPAGAGGGGTIFRRNHPNDLWELELTMQSLLDTGRGA